MGSTIHSAIVNHGSDLEPSASVLGGVVAMIRYCRFLLFGFEEDGLLSVDAGLPSWECFLFLPLHYPPNISLSRQISPDYHGIHVNNSISQQFLRFARIRYFVK
ncbi:hypothetical protein L1887_08862 [Cichorium endivia]|nr:hypothetical protein L1887_08862 [Cichorium endivia]